MIDQSSAIKCSCGSPDCQTRLVFSGGKELWITDKEGKETLMYVDPNTLAQLIREARATIIKATEPELGS